MLVAVLHFLAYLFTVGMVVIPLYVSFADKGKRYYRLRVLFALIGQYLATGVIAWILKDQAGPLRGWTHEEYAIYAYTGWIALALGLSIVIVAFIRGSGRKAAPPPAYT